jgi:RNA polymerase subunit RPABC4/transcription elongation factor Spt4
MKYCEKCRYCITNGSFCPVCGASGIESKTACSECKGETYIFDKFCSHCGHEKVKKED